MASSAKVGRLGNPETTLGTDPRLHVNLLQPLTALGLDVETYVPPEITPDLPLEHLATFARAVEVGLEGVYSSVDYSVPLPGDPNASRKLTTSEEVITGSDGNQIKLTFYRPTDAEGPLPAILYIHGGGMAILHTDIPICTTWAQALARSGMVAVLVDYRNALGPDGIVPFPAGLNDCADATRWVDAHREKLGISKIALQGESGGGNLVIATALKAKQEGWIQAIDGVCANVPFISGAYDEPVKWMLQELPSLVECDGYILANKSLRIFAKLYDPTGENAKNHLAWPYWATEEELKGLPPHLITTSELDPLKDEGNAFARRLLRAGVPTVAKMNIGMIHAGEIVFRNNVPDVFLEYVSSVKGFIDRL
ncbi:Carboxylesterase NlhH [Cladobotryum mycophilum]|uniref:Carboxylesterase NlhH n=1 Tax=Cladobotryum mycophilum TaxID=491253 RepID=A0ABR0S7Q2_9HYPO